MDQRIAADAPAAPRDRLRPAEAPTRISANGSSPRFNLWNWAWGARQPQRGF